MTPSILRTPAATDDSDTILNRPMRAVLSTCVPPQSSDEKSPMLTTRTTSPYFSPKSAVAPIFFASSTEHSVVVTGRPDRIAPLTSASVFSISSDVMAAKCEKSNLTLSPSTYEPACPT